MSTRYQMARSRVVGKYETQVAIEEFQSYIKDLKEPRPGLPGRDSAHWRMGLAYEQLGNRAGAETAYRAALTENPKHKPAKEALKALR